MSMYATALWHIAHAQTMERCMKPSTFFVATSIALFPSLATAQESKPQTIPFDSGNLTIIENHEGKKVLAYEGQELAKNYTVFHEDTVEVGDTKVAIFAVGDSGNACSPETVLIWKTEAGIQSTIIGKDECNTPPAAVTAYNIFFIPHPLPGEMLPVRIWNPEDGLTIHGNLAYAPTPGTDWSDLDPKKYENSIIAAFKNEAVYKAAQELQGDNLTSFATSLLISNGTAMLPSGAFYATGCVPHACGSDNGFMAIDAKARKLYMAQQTQAEPKAWPTIATWPTEFRDAMIKVLVDK